MLGKELSVVRVSSIDRSNATCAKSSSLLAQISKYLNIQGNTRSSQVSKNVELGLEIEINESVQRVLINDDSNSASSDDLLAVTILNPSESSIVHETTVALNKEDVRDFISMVKQHRINKEELDLFNQAVKQKPSSSSPPRSHSRPKHKSRSSAKTKLHDPFGKRDQQVYTTINTFDTLKDALPCKNKHRSEKPGVPCICQNCGIMDVLVQSQKGPVVDFPPLEDVRSTNDRDDRRRDRHKRDRRSKSHSSSLDIELLKEIYSRLSNLDKRLSIQEDRAVSKDYLKHVLHKIFSQQD